MKRLENHWVSIKAIKQGLLVLITMIERLFSFSFNMQQGHMGEGEVTIFLFNFLMLTMSHGRNNIKLLLEGKLWNFKVIKDQFHIHWHSLHAINKHLNWIRWYSTVALLRLQWSQSLVDIIYMICYIGGLRCVCVYVMNVNAGVYFGSFGCCWFSWWSVDCSDYMSWPARLKNQILQACMLNHLTAVVMLMNLNRLFRYGELLPSNTTCRIGVLKRWNKRRASVQ